MNISVIGFGIYSVALSLDMNENGHNVKIWSERNDDYKNKKDFAPILDMAIPEGISIAIPTLFISIFIECIFHPLAYSLCVPLDLK